jgi:hypothetical protein
LGQDHPGQWKLGVGLTAGSVPPVAADADADGEGLGSLSLDRVGAEPGGPAPERSRQIIGQPVSHQPDTAALLTHDCALAENGNPAAAYRLGRRYLFGLGVLRDNRMGVAWMRAAASRGYQPAIQVAALAPTYLGRLRPWCRPEAAPLRSPTRPADNIVELVRSMAPDYGLDPELVLAVMQTESAFHTDSVSPKDAAGLMQLIPETAARFGVSDVFDPADNIRGGMKYLQWLLAYFEGNVPLALAGYNAGEHAVDRHGGIPPYSETQAYVRLVLRLYPNTVHRFDPSITSPSSRFAGQNATAAP